MNLTLKQLLVNHKLLTVKPSLRKLKHKVSLFVNPVVKVNMVMFGSNLLQMKKERVTNSKTLSLVV